MKKPIEIEIDVESAAGYVRYTRAEVEGTVDIEPTGAVTADVDAAGEVVGIEILSVVDRALLEMATGFATKYGLAFPPDLSGTIAA